MSSDKPLIAMFDINTLGQGEIDSLGRTHGWADMFVQITLPDDEIDGIVFAVGELKFEGKVINCECEIAMVPEDLVDNKGDSNLILPDSSKKERDLNIFEKRNKIRKRAHKVVKKEITELLKAIMHEQLIEQEKEAKKQKAD